MKSILTLGLVTLGLLSAVACAKKDDAARTSEATTLSATLQPKAACNMQASLGTCNEYRAGTTFGLERTVCDSYKGKFGAGSCPAEGRIGHCEMSGGETKRYYAVGEHALTLTDAKADCESDLVKGTFQSEAL